MRLAHVVPSLEERHGGPSKSVRALANALGAPNDSVDLLSTLESGQPIAVPNAKEAAQLTLFPRVTPRWLCRSPDLRRHLQTVSYDCIHHHSLWLLTLRYAQEAAQRSRIPFVISPRGMMSGWAYDHHRGRKRLAELFVHPGAFKDAAGWHATSPEEADDIRRLGLSQPVCVSHNGVVAPSFADLARAREIWLEICPGACTRPVALFYSRFHRKKRLLELIDLWLTTSRGDWLLLIAGVAEEYSAAQINARIATAGARDKIMVFDGANRPPPYAIASLFVLPSRSENFGLVIAEALAAGVPALVTDTTPWQGLTREDCGWCVSWDKFASALATATALPPDELRIKGQLGRAWVEKDFSWGKAARLLREFYSSLGHG